MPETWEIRNTVGKDRIEELTQLYEELGFEVKVEAFQDEPVDGEVCDTCFGGGEYFVIYTRK
ncbi:MAG: hypothetical protein H8E46_12380 [FCB group bacterium]|nr:hypothetical protein [FCB group bacterium]